MRSPLRRSLAGVLGVLLWAAAPVSGEGIKSDFNGDGVVDLNDFFLFVEQYGRTSGQAGFDARFDVVGDGRIDQSDFFIFAQNFGKRADEPAPAGPRRTFFYVADFPGNGVSVMDSATNLTLGYLPFRGPSGIAISPDQRTTYVVDVFTFLALRDDFNVDYTLPLARGAKVALSPDNRLAFVTQDAANNVLFIDLAKRAVTDTVAVGQGPFGIATSPDGGRLYVVNTRSGGGGGMLSVVDVRSKTVRDSLRFDTAPGLIVVSPDGRRGFLNSANGGAITVVDLASNRVAGAIQTGGQSVYGMGFSPDGKRLYAAASGRVVVIDAERNLILDRINVADDTGPLTVSPDGGRLYVSAFSQAGGGAAIYILDLATRQTLGKVRGFAFPIDLAFRATSTDFPASRRNKPAPPESPAGWVGREGAWRPTFTEK